MALPEIKFGTDGWRGVTGDDFTYASVRRVAQGIAEYMRSRTPDPLAVVGYDCRFASEEFARGVADIFAANGVRSLIFDRASPTQVASWTVIDRKATGAAVITASHNPYLFNGVKYKPETGSSAPTEVINELEKHINALPEIPGPDRETVASLVTVYDPRAAYYKQVGRIIDLDRIRNAGLRIVHECMHGSGYGYVAELAGIGGRTAVRELHSDRNPFFGGRPPEPIPPNIDDAIAVMEAGGHDLCILTDGDADRVGIIDETGRFINQLQVFALLVLHLFDVMGMRGPIVKTVNMSAMVEQLAKQFGTEVYEVPVGFKFVAPKMMETNAVIGG
jgi:phosphomannomutase